MKRKEILQAMYELVGGTSPCWISDFQKLGNQVVGNPDFLESTEQALDDMADWNYHFRDLEAIIQYEKKIQSLFKDVADRLEYLVDNNRSRDDIEQLQNDLEDIVDTIRISYITLNSNYQNYENRANDIFDKINELD